MTRKRGALSKVSIKGVLIGSILDIVSSVILGMPFGIYAVSQVDVAHTPKEQLQSAVSAAMHSNMSLYLGTLLVGMACSVLGGFVAAWLAKHDELLNGALSSILCVLGAVWSISAGKDPQPMWTQTLLLIASPALGLLGGYLRLRQRSPAAQSA
jgi:putative membrane protein (TIGR04086 family)